MSKVNAVVFDWAGTLIDFGSFAPMGAFVRVFDMFGITVTIEQARAPMGAAKRDHIRAMLDMPEIAAQWRSRFGAAPTQADLDALYTAFLPLNEDVAADYATLVPGAKAAIDALRDMGLKIGSTTGYTRSIMDRVLPVVAEQGFVPDTLVCSDDLPETRPGPLGMYQCFINLRVYPPHSVIKVDDTAPGILEGVAAGCVTVGVALSGNTVGLSPQDLAALPATDRDSLRRKAGTLLKEAGADHIIDTVADLPALVRQLAGLPIGSAVQ